MTRSLFFRSLLLSVGLLPAASPAIAGSAPNAVVEWATLIQPAIHNAAAPRSAGTSQILHTMVVLAMYDAVVAIEGGYRPYAAGIEAPRDADVRAAVATAAYLTARMRVYPSQLEYLDKTYAAFMAAIPDGLPKADGAHVGQQAAEAVLARRADDHYGITVPYECSSVPPPPGEFEPDGGCPATPQSPQPVDAKVGRIRPFTYRSPTAFRPGGPAPFRSRKYSRDFAEVRDLGRADSTVRTPEQTDVAYFWSENPYVHWNRNLVGLAVSRGLDVVKTARLFALVHTAASDAIIAGFAAKYHFTAWRPRTAIPRADEDGNPHTDADPTWKPLLSVNHPEYPSGHGFWSTAVVGAVAAFFGTTQVPWTITTSKAAVPQLVKTERTYPNLLVLLGEIGQARIWGGLHFRHAVEHGSIIGGRVAAHVATRHFRPQRGRHD